MNECVCVCARRKTKTLTAQFMFVLLVCFVVVVFFVVFCCFFFWGGGLGLFACLVLFVRLLVYLLVRSLFTCLLLARLLVFVWLFG